LVGYIRQFSSTQLQDSLLPKAASCIIILTAIIPRQKKLLMETAVVMNSIEEPVKFIFDSNFLLIFIDSKKAFEV
jgi:hypothetical protein